MSGTVELPAYKVMPTKDMTDELWVNGTLISISQHYEALGMAPVSHELPVSVSMKEVDTWLDLLRWAPSMSCSSADAPFIQLLQVLQKLDKRICGVGWMEDKSKWMIIFDEEAKYPEPDPHYALAFIRLLYQCIPRDLRAYLLISKGNPRQRGVFGSYTFSWCNSEN